MRLSGVFAVCVLAALAAGQVSAEAGGRPHVRTALSDNVLHVSAGEATSVPYGWAEFCGRPENASDCNVPALAAADAVMDERAWSIARRVNREVNAAVEPVSDQDNYGVAEYWSYPDNGKGDCEDYVLLKRRELMRQGFPREALLVTVVRDHVGEGHAVLMLKTTSGDFILDNKLNAVRPWSETGYHYVKRQSQDNPNVWVSLRAPDVTTVASTKRR